MRTLFYLRKGTLEWVDAPDIDMTSDMDAIVRPIAVARCDLDDAFLRHDLGRPLQLAHAAKLVDQRLLDYLGRKPFAGPFPFGHECVAEVLEVGHEVRSVRRGDVVVVPFQISCGSCRACTTGLTASCTTAGRTPVSMYGLGAATGGWGGAMTDRLRVPYADHMLLPIPPDVEPATLASAADNIPDGWRAVAHPLNRRPSAPVLVLGGQAKSVGLYAAASALALGAESVDYLDTDPQRLGARPVERAASWRRTPARRGEYPVVVDANGERGALAYAIKSLAPGGICTSVALYFATGTRVPMWELYVRQGTLTTGLANARAELPAVLAAVATGSLRPELVTGVLADWEDAPQALLARATKVVVTRARITEASTA
ncbi:alcohol dehydrogenase catalytic domain-containing protein [Pseudonocardia sp. TRM90224]|uniref:alcohol dehydrogenase catalytic domain-containing protein n=1 Tax=Pseudonocardia sp. TRM90224 TaxID=2812678 RepID=UPI001E31720D|nr:alcohol dehydrogenase catalytic domain-containing protein [Pseudonocardia sp. TRM90224]